MHPFQYQRAESAAAAVSAVAANTGATFIAGGTSHIDLMKEDVHRPTLLVDFSWADLQDSYVSIFRSGFKESLASKGIERGLMGWVMDGMVR